MKTIPVGFLAVLVLLTGTSAADGITTIETIPLVNSTAFECAPVWREDGIKLFYASNESGNFNIWIIDADGTNKTRITNDSADEFPSLSWSTWENGSIMDKIVYISQSVGSDIWIIDADGTNESKLTDSGYNIDPAIVCVPLPQISNMQPSGTIDNNIPAINANFSCSYGNVSTVNLLVDGIDVTSNANVMDSNVSYIPIEPLDCGNHNFTVQVESDLYTVGHGYETFTIAYITNPKPTCVFNNTPTISANISCSYGGIATVTISVGGVNVTSNATIADSYISYTPTGPLLNGTHNATVCVNSTHGINDSMTWVFYVNYCPPCGGVACAGCSCPCAPKIVFASNRSGNFDIWMMNMDGTGLIQLTNSPSNETHPAAADSKIVYVSDESGSRDLWSMDLNGSNKQQLTSSAVDACMPAWSPIGGIVYTQRSCGGGDYNLFAMNTDGTGKRRLTNNPSDELSPVFSQSPYQLKVAYAIKNDDSDIWTTSFKETDDKVGIWHLEGWYVLVCKGVYGNEVWLELAKNGTMVDGVVVAVNESFSIDDLIITGTLQNVSVFDDSTFEIQLVNVTQYSVDGEVLYSNRTKILTNAPIYLDTMHGDLDLDGEISTADATIMLEIAVGNCPCDAATLATADMNGDGQVTSIDALMVLQAAAG